MKETAVRQIANKLNISKSTVSKAIRHCSGVDSETRQSVLNEIRLVNCHTHSDCAIYAIIPDVPHYFWKELRRGICAGEQTDIAPVKYNIYTNARDEETVLSYLDEAERLNACAIIISAYITPKIHQRLTELCDGRLILFLCEYHDLINGFFVGGDPYMDGYLMGKQYLSLYADRNLVLLSIPNNNNIQKRLDGFRQAIKEEKAELIDAAISIDIEKSILKDAKLLPSKLAPLLVDVAKANDSLCIYAPFGMLQLPLVITKAKLTNHVVCMCHDYFSEKNDSCITVTCNQDVIGQGRKAADIATYYVKEHIYPDEKRTIIPSVLKVSPN